MCPLKPVTHVIFDMDGLLLDTERLYTDATQAIASQYSKVYTWEIKVRCMGMKGSVAAEHIIESLQLPLTVDEYLEKIVSQYDALFPNAKVLPDTVDLYLFIHNQALASYGQSVTWAHIMAEMGHTGLEVAQKFCVMFDLKVSPDEYFKRVTSFYPELFPTVKLMRGAEKLVRHLHKHNIPIAIASGGAQDSYELKTTNHKEFVTMFNHVVLASSDPEVKNGKPAPDVFLICASRFSDTPKPEQCLVFEDAPNGVAAGVAAGMQVVMVPDSRLDDKMTKGASQVLKSLEDFKPELFGLPKYDD